MYYKIVRLIKNFPSSVKDFIQRGRRGWSDTDAYNAFYHIAKINIGMLEHIKELGHSYPAGLAAIPRDFNPTRANQNIRLQNIYEIDKIINHVSDLDNGIDRWNAMLDYFINGWEAVIELDEATEMIEIDYLLKQFESMLRLYGQYFLSLWD